MNSWLQIFNNNSGREILLKREAKFNNKQKNKWKL